MAAGRASALAGFTLVELVFVVAIVAVLAAIAYPSYQAQVRKGHRAAAQAYLMDLAQRQQQYLLDARSYAGDAPTLGYVATPSEVANWYSVAIAAPVVSPPAFTITATAVGAQALDAATRARRVLQAAASRWSSSSSSSRCSRCSSSWPRPRSPR